MVCFFSFYTLRKSLQTTSASPCRMVGLLTSSVLSTTSKQCVEKPAANFLVCSLIFIEYENRKNAWSICLCVYFYITNYKHNKNIKKETKKEQKVINNDFI
ncbi:S1 RNA-binding domain-containing protein [Streptococcus pneumoniae]|nr:S1 RNA-binding domain-containing protein [Streptococcus pneumoniae]